MWQYCIISTVLVVVTRMLVFVVVALVDMAVFLSRGSDACANVGACLSVCFVYCGDVTTLMWQCCTGNGAVSVAKLEWWRCCWRGWQ